MWKIVDQFVDETPGFLYRHHVESFNEFCDQGLFHLLKRSVKCDKLRWKKVNTESEARRCGTTYKADVCAVVSGKEDVFLFSLPVMVGSKLDGNKGEGLLSGGFFIIDGKETFVKWKEVWNPDEVIVSAGKPGSKYGWTACCKGLVVGLVRDTESEAHGELEVVLEAGQKPIPFFVLMRCLGCLSDREIVAHCLLGRDDPVLIEEFRPSVQAAGQVFTRAAAAALAGESVNAWSSSDRIRKAFQLGRMAKKVLSVRFGREPCDVASSGDISKKVLRSTEEFLLKVVGKVWDAHLSKKPEERELDKHCFDDEVGKTVLAAILKKSKHVVTLKDPSYFERMAILREVTVELPRLPHPTQFGAFDAYEATQLALMVRITGKAIDDAAALLKKLPTLVAPEEVRPEEHGKLVQVFLDGAWSGSTVDPAGFRKKCLELRRSSPPKKEGAPLVRPGYDDFNVHWDVARREIHLRTTPGRLQRPLFYVDLEGMLSCDAAGKWVWSEPGVVEYLDCQETGVALIAAERGDLTPRHTHLELHGAVQMGARANVAGVLLPHTSFEGGARYCELSSKMVTAPLPNFPPRLVALTQTEAPFVQSALYRRAAAPPYGVNALVAVMCCGGFGCALTLNQAALDRGLFQVTCADGVRPPEVGDKFVFRNGNVQVCGTVAPEKDMPFVASTGVRPDLLLDPTMVSDPAVLILEGLMGQVHLKLGSFAEGSAFETNGSFDAYVEELRRSRILSEEPMQHGLSGDIIETPVFFAPMYVAVLARDVESDPVSGEVFGEDEFAALCAHGMTSTVAEMARDGTNRVDAVTGGFSLRNEELNLEVAPALDGPIEVGGDYVPNELKKYPNRFRTVTGGKEFRAWTQELSLANVSLQLVTMPPRIPKPRDDDRSAAMTQFRALLPITPENLVSSFASADSPRLFSYPKTERRTRFPFLYSEERLRCISASSLEIVPTADKQPNPLNSAKLDMTLYSAMDWRAAENGLKYLFERVNSGVFVRIKNNQVVNFEPVGNAAFVNDFLAKLSLDGKAAATPQALSEAVGAPDPEKWSAAGRTLRTGSDPAEGGLAQLYEMIVETCSHRTVGDCFFLVNRLDHPILGADGQEAFPAFYGAKADSKWSKKYVPVLSQCSSKKHADVAIPTHDDWEAITGRKYSAKEGGPTHPETVLVDWTERKAVFEDDLGSKLPVFYWSGTPMCGLDDHPRTLLEKLAEPSTKSGRRTRLSKSGVLRVQYAGKAKVAATYVPENGLIRLHVPRDKEEKDGKKRRTKEEDKGKDKNPFVRLEELAKDYKFVFNIEGNGASQTLGCLFKYAFCVINVETDYELWFQPWLKGGSVSNYREDWAYLQVKRDLSDLDDTLAWCVENDDKCRRVAANGRKFYEMYLTKAFVYDYVGTTLNSISARQRRSEFSPSEELALSKELHTLYGRSVQPKWTPFRADGKGGSQMYRSVIIVVLRKPEEKGDLALFLKHYENRNVLVVKEAGETVRRGALINAAVHFLSEQVPEVTTFVVLDLAARFKYDFAAAYFCPGEQDMVDLGKAANMPLGWAVRFSKEAYAEINGFPNTFVADEVGEGEALGERMYWARRRRTLYFPQNADGLAGPTPAMPSKSRGDSTKANVLRDRLQWRMDGLNTVMYKVKEHVLGDWTATPPTTSSTVRTLTVEVVPITSPSVVVLADPLKRVEELGGSAVAEEPKAEPRKEVVVVVDTARDPSTEVASLFEADSPTPGNDRNKIVEVFIDAMENHSNADSLPLLENTEVVEPTQSIKVIKFDA